MAEKVEKAKPPGPTKHIPKDAQVIMSIMRDMDITEYEPRVINQLLEFIYRFVNFTLRFFFLLKIVSFQVRCLYFRRCKSLREPCKKEVYRLG